MISRKRKITEHLCTITCKATGSVILVTYHAKRRISEALALETNAKEIFAIMYANRHGRSYLPKEIPLDKRCTICIELLLYEYILAQMTCILSIRCKHALLYRKCTFSSNQAKTILVGHSLSVHRPEAMANINTNIMTLSIIRVHIDQSKVEKDQHISDKVLKDVGPEKIAHIRYSSMSMELLNSMKEQRLDKFLNIPHNDSELYENEKTFIFLSTPVYRMHTLDHM